MIRIIVFSALFAAAFAEKVAFQNCAGEVIFVDIHPCATKTNGNCDLKKGQDVTFTLQFKAKQYSRTAIVCGTASVNLIFQRATYNIPCNDACPQIGCPVTDGSVNTVQATFKLDSPFTANNVDIRLEVKGDNNSLLACATFKVNIKA